MKIRFSMRSNLSTVKIEGVRREVDVAFCRSSLPDTTYYESTVHYTVSDRPIKGASKYTHGAYPIPYFADALGRRMNGWQYVSKKEKTELDICEKWLVRLFGRVPKNLYFRRETGGK